MRFNWHFCSHTLIHSLALVYSASARVWTPNPSGVWCGACVSTKPFRGFVLKGAKPFRGLVGKKRRPAFSSRAHQNKPLQGVYFHMHVWAKPFRGLVCVHMSTKPFRGFVLKGAKPFRGLVGKKRRPAFSRVCGNNPFRGLFLSRESISLARAR